jgi:mRNA interferase MazF
MGFSFAICRLSYDQNGKRVNAVDPDWPGVKIYAIYFLICAITSNISRAKAPGNVLLRKGEANISKPSIVNVSQAVTVDKSILREKIGTLSAQRIQEIVAGLRLVFEPREL